jgi:hypothetical protein
VAIAAVTIVAVSFRMGRSELIQNDRYDLGELWRTKSDTENILGSLAMTRRVGETNVHHGYSSESTLSKVVQSIIDNEPGGCGKLRVNVFGRVTDL